MESIYGRTIARNPLRAVTQILGRLAPNFLRAAAALHAILIAKVASWPAWMQLLHPIATVIAKSKLLVLPVYLAAWPQARKHAFVQFMVATYRSGMNLYLVRKIEFRYRYAECVAASAVDQLERAAGVSRAAIWFRKTEETIEDQSIIHKPSQKPRLFYQRWSIKFSAEYYEVKEREAALSPQIAPSP